MWLDKPIRWTFIHTLILTVSVLGALYLMDAPLRIMVYAACVYPTIHIAMRILRG
jgi:hypothetical protein